EPLVWNPIVLFATEALFRTTDPVVVIDPVTAKVEDMVTAPVIRAVPTTCNLALGTIPVPIPKLPDASTTKRSAPAVASYKVKGAFDIPVDPATNRHSLPDAPVLWNLIEDCSAPDPDTVSRCVPAEVPIPTFPVIETGRTIVMAPPVALVIVMGLSIPEPASLNAVISNSDPASLPDSVVFPARIVHRFSPPER